MLLLDAKVFIEGSIFSIGAEMIPGRGRISPRQMQRMMKQLGISIEEIEDVEEVIIKTATKDFLIKNPSVTIMDAQGQKTYQVMGETKIVEKEEKLSIPLEDIKLVAEQANVSEDEARKALEECDGNPAEAIMKLIG